MKLWRWQFWFSVPESLLEPKEHVTGAGAGSHQSRDETAQGASCTFELRIFVTSTTLLQSPARLNCPRLTKNDTLGVQRRRAPQSPNTLQEPVDGSRQKKLKSIGWVRMKSLINVAETIYFGQYPEARTEGWRSLGCRHWGIVLFFLCD